MHRSIPGWIRKTVPAFTLAFLFCAVPVADALAQETTPEGLPIDATPVVPENSSVLQGKIGSKPILIAYARNISPQHVMDYVRYLGTQIEIGDEFRKQIDDETQSEQLERIQPKVTEPLYGTAMYMVTGLVPSFEAVTFQQVLDEDDARRLAEGRKQQWGDQGTLEDLGNGCFKVEYRSSHSYPLPEGADESQYLQQNNSGSRSYQYNVRIVEKDGKKHVEQSTVMTNLMRYHDRLLFEASFPELFEMELPSNDTIASAVEGSRDMGFNAYLDRIPMGLRQLGFTMLSAAAGSQMQQGDEESETTYRMRRSAGDMALSLVQSVLFDIDNSDGWARFAYGDEEALRGELRIRARSNSQLSQRLLEAAGTSRFAPILSDNAAVTLHVCVRLPEQAPESLQATATWLTETFDAEFRNDPTMIAAGESLSSILEGIAEHRTLELLLKLGWSEASQGVIYGGLQVSEDPDLLKNLHYFLTHIPGADSDIAQQIRMEERSGMPVIVLQCPEEGVEEIRAATGANVTHIYLAHQNGCLLFAAGTETSTEMLRQVVDRCTQNSRAVRTPLISGRIDMAQWLSYPQTDTAGIAQMPWWLDENSWSFPPSPMMAFAMQGDPDKPRPLMQKVFDLGGAQHAGFTLDSDESGILLQAHLGKALANHMIARMIDSQDKMMREQTRRMEEQQKAAREQREKLKEQQPQPVPAPSSN
jgi:hypothetical protein